MYDYISTSHIKHAEHSRNRTFSRSQIEGAAAHELLCVLRSSIACALNTSDRALSPCTVECRQPCTEYMSVVYCGGLYPGVETEIACLVCAKYNRVPLQHAGLGAERTQRHCIATWPSEDRIGIHSQAPFRVAPYRHLVADR